MGPNGKGRHGMARKVLAGLMVLAGLAMTPGAVLAQQEAATDLGTDLGTDPGPESGADLGAYLAARAAGIAGDFDAAATYFTRTIADDPDNPMLLDNAMAAWLGLDAFDRALELAQRIQAGGFDSQIAGLVLATDAARRGDWDGLTAGLDAGQLTYPLIDALARAWAQVGRGDMDRALAAFDTVIATRGMVSFGLYHKALALAFVGDFEAADAILSLPPDRGMQATRRAIIAHVQVLSQLGRNDDAVGLIDTTFPGTSDPTLRALRDRLAAGDALPWTLVGSAADGLAEVFYTIARTIGDEADPASILFYARAARILNPDLWEAQLLAGQMLDRLGQYDLANAAYAAVPPDDASFVIAEVGRADALNRAGQADVAIEVLTALLRDHADMPGVLVSLADILRRTGRHDQAAPLYAQAIALYPAGDRALAYLHFVHGITFTHLDNWPAAEAALRASLAINPDQAGVLNYLGYSLVERGERLDEALTMIEAAVQTDPQNGAIVDSLGWALFRLGRAADAVPHMEQAAALLPTDPVINDHLGDVYWTVGRIREAAFQWRRALSFAPDEDEATRIRRKLDIGLDAVLAEEAATPPQVAGSDG